MADVFRLKIVTPDKVVFDDDINMIVFNTTEGFIGVLKKHIPLTTLLASGVATMTIGDEKKEIAIHEGFAEITGELTTILCDAAEWPHEINVKRATQAKQRAEDRLKSSEMDSRRANLALMRAISRIDLASKQ